MSQSIYNSRYMKKVKNELNDALEYFDICIKHINSLDIPSFSYSGWIASLPSTLKEYKRQCSLDVDWCYKVIEKFDNFNDESIRDINSVKVQNRFSKAYDINNIV